MDYKRFHQECMKMLHRVRDWTDNPSHPGAKELQRGFQKLEDDVQVQKNPASIEHHLKHLESLLGRLPEEVMSHHHVDELTDWVQDARRKVR